MASILNLTKSRILCALPLIWTVSELFIAPASKIGVKFI
jgi:hypothetical protein